MNEYNENYDANIARNDSRSRGERRSSRESGSTRQRRSGNRRGGGWRTAAAWILRVLGTLLLIGVVTGGLMLCFAVSYIQTEIIPNAQLTLTDYDSAQTTTMYYQDTATGEYVPMSTFYGEENRTWVSYDEIPQDLIHAAVAIEDKRFYQHKGVDWWRTAAGIYYMFTGHDIQGGSTITQQLIKNITSDNEVTVKRKILEIFRALELEKKYSKEMILEYYLNYVYFGSSCYGVEAASQYYFGKSVSDLDLAECASLISITNNPSLYNPRYHLDKNQYRQGLVLDAMADPEQGYITQEQCDAAKAETLNFVFDDGGQAELDHVYSWFEEQVITDVIDDLQETYGYSKEVATDMFYSGGLEIYTTVNPEIQAVVEEIYGDTSNLDYISASGQQMQSAITLIDNATGNVVAIAGGLGEKTTNRSWNMATRTYRQPGSSIKPISVYAPAIEEELITPYSIVDDYPYQVLNNKAWPTNSHGGYSGLQTVSEAVRESTNTVAVRVLGDLVTIPTCVDYLENVFHISSLESGVEVNGEIKNDYGLAQLALGGLTTGVNTREMAAAYAVFPNNGIYSEPRTYTQVLDSDGNIILDNQPDAQVALSLTTAYYMNTMLQQVVTSGTGTEARLSGMSVAGKTGTTTDNYDRWFVGYTPYYTAAVWTGYMTPEKMSTGYSNPAAVMWKKVMSQIHEGLSDPGFTKPDNLKTVSICLDCGNLATQACANDIRGSRVTTGTFVSGTQPTAYCTCHKEIEVCTESNLLAGPYCPEELVKVVYAPDFNRTSVAGVAAQDAEYLYSTIAGGAACDIHLTEPVTEPDPDPSTQPVPGAGEEPQQEPGSNHQNPSAPSQEEPVDNPSEEEPGGNSSQEPLGQQPGSSEDEDLEEQP